MKKSRTWRRRAPLIVLVGLSHYFVYAWGSAADDNLALNLSTRPLSAVQ